MENNTVIYVTAEFYCLRTLFIFRDFLALNVYVALCYYKLDYFDVSQVNSLFFSTTYMIPNLSRQKLLSTYSIHWLLFEQRTCS